MKTVMLIMFAVLFLLVPVVNAVEDGAINVQIPVGSNNVILRTNFNEGNVLEQRLEVFSEPNELGNNPFDFITSWIFPETGTAYKIHDMNDDACPRRYNGVILGGNHGLYAVKIKSANHGLGQQYIGTKWKFNPDTGHDFYIVRVVDDGNSLADKDYVWLLSQNIGADDYNWAFFYPTVDNTYTLVYDDLDDPFDPSIDPSVSIGIDVSAKQMLFPVIKNRTISVNINGTEYYSSPTTIPINEDVYGEVSIVEEYEIINPVSSVEYYINKHYDENGNFIENVQFPELFNVGDSQIRMRYTYIFDKWGGCTVEASSINLEQITENGWGVIQSAALWNGVGGGDFDNQYYYMPNVNNIPEVDAQGIIIQPEKYWDFGNIENFNENPRAYLRYLEGVDASQTTWSNFETPPYRSIQFLGNTKDDLEVGYQIAYDTNYGSAIPEVRKDNIKYNAWSGAYTINSSKKSYPYLFDYPPNPVSTYEARAFRGYFDPKKYSDNATSVQLFKIEEGKYRLFVDYHKNVKTDIINLPTELENYKLVTIDSYLANKKVYCTHVEDGKIYLYSNYDPENSNFTGYVYVVFDIVYDPDYSQYQSDKTYYVSNDGSDDNEGGVLDPFASWQKAVDVALPGNVIKICPGPYGAADNSYNYYVEGGYYKYGMYIEGKRDITIEGLNPDDKPILDCSGLNYPANRIGVFVNNSYNITLKDLEIRNVPQFQNVTEDDRGVRGNGIKVSNSPYTYLKNLSVHLCEGTGICLYDQCEGVVVENCDSYRNYDKYTRAMVDTDNNPTTPDEITNVRGQDADGFRCIPSDDGVLTGKNIKFIGCRSWNNSDDGWDLFGIEEQIIIENCWAFHNGWDPENDTENDLELNPWYVSGGTADTFYGNGTGFKLGANTYLNKANFFNSETEQYTGDDYSNNPPSHIVRNCIAYDNINGFNSNNSFRKQYWYNNTSVKNHEKNYIIWQYTDNTIGVTDPGWSGLEDENDFILRNNISYPKQNALPATIEIDDSEFNSWNDGFDLTYDDFVNYDSSVDYFEDMKNAVRLNGSLPGESSLPVLDFFKLDNYSDMIDNGTDVIESGIPNISEYFGFNPDLGCYENENVYRVNDVEELTEEELIINDGEYLISDGGALNCHENSKITVKDGGVLQTTDANFSGVEGEGEWLGIYAEDGGTVRLTRTDISNAECALSGVHIGGYVSDCDISECNNGIELTNCDHFMLKGNSITGNNTSESIGVLLTQYSTNNTETFNSNTISNFDTGVSIISCSPELTNNIIENNTSYGMFISGYNTFPVLKDYEAVDDDRNNVIINNGVAQIGMKYAAGAYMDQGWNNIYSGNIPCIPSVPCLLGISEFSKALLPISVLIPASENYWGYSPIYASNYESFFDLYQKYQLDYSDYNSDPYTEQQSKRKNNEIRSGSKELLAKAIGLRNDGKIKQAIDDIEKLLKKYSDSSEYYVALYMLPGLYKKEGMSLGPILNLLETKLKSDDVTINKKFHKEMKVYVKMLDEKYDEAIKISEEMKSEATSDSEIILAEVDIAVANLMKGGQKNRKDTKVIRNLVMQLMGYEKSTSGIDPLIPNKTKLYQNYPNPFNPVTQIKYDIAALSDVKLNIYNTNGQLVANLIDGKVNPGFHTANFDASKLNSGVYIYTLQVGDKAFSKKMVLIK